MFSEKEDLSSIPGFQDIPKEEINLYFTKFAPAAVRASELLTQIYSGTACKNHYLSCPGWQKDGVTNSADVERSNSIYKLVLSSRRRSLSEPNIKALVFLYFNLKVQCALQSDHKHDDDEML